MTVAKRPGQETGASVFDVGQHGKFDSAWAASPALLFDGQRFRMWYSSLYDSKMGKGGIGLAVSDDGNTWTRLASGDPVLALGEPGSFDGGQVMGPAVLFDGRTYRMWYTGMATKWHESGFGHYRIGLAISVDGIRWQRANDGKPVLDLGPRESCDEVQAATPSVLREAHGYRMWYAAWSPKHGHTVACARSVDGVRWRRENAGRPVSGLSNGAYGPDVCRLGENYLMVYMALRSSGLHAAISSDGIAWRPLNDGKAILDRGSGAAFDEYRLGHPCLLPMGDVVRLWYTGYRREAGGVRGWKLRIGAAELRAH